MDTMTDKTITFAPYIDKERQYKILETMLHFYKENVDNLPLVARLNGHCLTHSSTDEQIRFI